MNDNSERTNGPSTSFRVRTAAYVAIGLITGFIVGNCMREPPEILVERVEVPGPSPPPEQHEISRILLPFYEADVKNCDPTDFGAGASLSKEADATLELIARGLQWCGDGEVTIDVQGFSSQRTFDCGGPDVSDHLNIELAEARREDVIVKLKAHLAKNASTFPRSVVRFQPTDEAPRWSGVSDRERLAEMRRYLAFDDHVNEVYGKTPETFTRRVDIVVVEKGRCDVLSK